MTAKTNEKGALLLLAGKNRKIKGKLIAERTDHKLTKKELSIAQEFIATLTQENLELGKINEDLRNRFVNGGISYTINNGMVSGISIIQPVSEFTYCQEQIEGMILEKLIEIMQTPLYQKLPFVYEEKRQLKINKTKYNKYLIGGNLV